MLRRPATRSVSNSAVFCEGEAVFTDGKRVSTTAALLLGTCSAFAESPYQGMQKTSPKGLAIMHFTIPENDR
jgi:hypothetical protein